MGAQESQQQPPVPADGPAIVAAPPGGEAISSPPQPPRTTALAGDQDAARPLSFPPGASERLGAWHHGNWATEEGDDEDDEVRRRHGCPCLADACGTQKERCNPCYCCFTLTLIAFTLVFPLFLRWLVTSPIPSEYWNEDFPKFPPLNNKSFIKYRGAEAYNIELSDIPDTWSGCNYSCTTGRRSGSETSEMSFSVQMRLNAAGYKHTAYPVLFASSDFKTWKVASDRTDAVASEFFPSGAPESANTYHHVTEECARPPDVIEDGEPQLLEAFDGFGSLPLYAMVCVAWSWDSIRWHAGRSAFSSAEMGEHCQAIGGVCGWPCGSRPHGKQLPACSAAGVIDVEAIREQVGVANFSGEVTLQACLQGNGEECTTSTTPMSKWPCHQCAVTGIEATEKANKTYQLRYDSLPRMEVVLRSMQLQNADAVPHAYIVTSTVDPQGRGPAALYGSSWRKLYFDHEMVVSDPHLHPKPVPVERLEAKWTPHPVRGVPAPWADGFKPGHFFKNPMRLRASLNKMKLMDHSRVELQPEQCFASRGPLYLVACAVNQSTHADSFEFAEGQEVAPPPFNDRCLTVTGKCAYACMSQQRPGLHHCGADGLIPQDDLWEEDFEAPNNSGEPVVGVICLALMIGFAVKLLTYCPGLFSPYKHPQHYDVVQTESFKYIAVCVPSGSETKACVLRNLVGALSALPVGCECPYHVVFADEGHRHSHKVMFRAFAQVIHCLPDSRMTSGRNMEIDARRMRGDGHYKEGNLKAFTKYWVEATRALTLKDCDTPGLKMRAKELGRQAPHDRTAKDEVRRLTEVIDRLCGLTALRRLQNMGWPKGEESAEVRALEAAIVRLGNELCIGEQEVASDTERGEAPKASRLDDCEAYYWQPTPHSVEENVPRLYTLHYVARARPDEDERTVKVQHVAVGTWYYTIPKDEEQRAGKAWLEWRRQAREYQGEVLPGDQFVVPLRTSRGKAGALNFCENYLYEYGTQEHSALKYALFGVADARHQFQPDFFHATIPHFFKDNNRDIDSRVAFAQSPQHFPEIPDDIDYLDTNNASFFRLNCMLRNCVGGVSSCGTNCTWLVRDRRAGRRGFDSTWETRDGQRLNFREKLEHRFFQETCKVEHTASSLDRVVKGKLSRYVNQRLSFGMVKDPTDYLGAVQRWGEGAAVLSMRTFLALGDGALMLWMSLLLFLAFILSVANMVHGWGYEPLLEEFTKRSGNDILEKALRSSSDWVADRALDLSVADAWFGQVFYGTFLEVQIWFLGVVLFTGLLAFMTMASSVLHRCCCVICGSRPMTRFPTTASQWVRLGITLDNLTYFLWFWIAFFWVGLNYYAIWSKRWHHFDERGMVFFTYILQVLGWSLVITASFRYRTEQGLASNEVLFLSLTNVWRTTQLFYITAPLLLYSFLMGSSDFTRSRTAGVDVSYWASGDSAVSKLIAQCWTLLLIAGAVASHIFFWSNGMPHGSVGGLLIVTFIALDVLQPCAFMWLGIHYEEPPPELPHKALPSWQHGLYRSFQLLFSAACWRNVVRVVVFHPNSTFIVKWLGPLQNILFPALTWSFPELGLNQVLLLLASRSS